LLIGLTGTVSAAELCTGAVADVATRGGWTRTVKDDVVSYRAPSGQEMLTMAVYRLDDRFASASGRIKVLNKAAELDRDLDRRLSGSAVLSAVKRSSDGVLQVCYSGEDATGRRFVSLSLAAGPFMQHFYYEALGFSRVEFARSGQAVFGFGLPSAPGVARLARPPDAALTLRAARLPDLFGR
jgi:hypothetical protein